MTVTNTPRPTKVVLAEALAELQAREAKLKRLEQELADNRAAIRVLRKLVGDTPVRAVPQPAAEPEPPAAPSVPAGDRDRLVLQIIGEHQPCARSTLLQRTNLGPGALKTTLDRLREEGKVRMVGQKVTARYLLVESDAESEAA